MKKIFICFITCLLWIMTTFYSFAKENNVNIYDEPRDMIQRPFYGFGGKKFQASDFKGHFTMFVFWSKHCSPCVKELDELNAFALKANQEKNIQVVPVVLEAEWNDWQESKDFMSEYRAPDLDSFLDRKGDFAADLGIFRMPHTVLVNKKGQEIGRIRGAVEWTNPKVIEYMYDIIEQNQ